MSAYLAPFSTYGRIKSKIADKTYPNGAHFEILMTDGRTDGQTDVSGIAITRFTAALMIRVKTVVLT